MKTSFRREHCRWLRLIDFNDHNTAHGFHKSWSKGVITEHIVVERVFTQSTIHISRWHFFRSSPSNLFELFFVIFEWVEREAEKKCETPKSARLATQKKWTAADNAMMMMISKSIIHRVLINISSFLMTYFSSSLRTDRITSPCWFFFFSNWQFAWLCFTHLVVGMWDVFIRGTQLWD